MLMIRHDGSGSPQRSQSGGVNGVMLRQQSQQTGPRVGSGSGRSQAAQAGARMTASRPSIARLKILADLDSLGVAPQPLESVELAGVR
jgi:hypothetical protein